MKRVSSAEPFHFNYSGTRQFDITPEGVLATDVEAATMLSRFGVRIKITDMEPDTLETLSEPAPELPVEPEPMPTDVEPSEPVDPQ